MPGEMSPTRGTTLFRGLRTLLLLTSRVCARYGDSVATVDTGETPASNGIAPEAERSTGISIAAVTPRGAFASPEERPKSSSRAERAD